MDHESTGSRVRRSRVYGGRWLDRVLATLLVTDIVDSTARTHSSSATARGATCWPGTGQAVRAVLDRFRGREVATTGDGFVAVFDGAERAIHAAQEIGRVASGIGLVIRAAVHTGEIEPESFWRARRSASLIAACAS